MKESILIDPSDNLGVALRSLAPGEIITLGEDRVEISMTIPPKHKFSLREMAVGDRARMYGVTVGIATQTIPSGGLVTTSNLKHRTSRSGRAAISMAFIVRMVQSGQPTTGSSSRWCSVKRGT